MIVVNPTTRQFNIPGADLVFGVTADAGSEVKHFQCPRRVGNNLDLTDCFIRMNYQNANGEIDFYLVKDVTVDGDNVSFSWNLAPKVTMYKGNVSFVMCVTGPDTKVKWHTTLGRGQVLEGLEPDNAWIESATQDGVAALIAMVEAQTAVVEKTGADQVAVVKAAAKAVQDSAVAEIEAKGKNTRDSIPVDYTALSEAVDTLTRNTAPGIVCSAEGEVITLNDASDNYLRGLRIFGKSTQDGIPTPENPVEIVSLGADGSVGVTINGLNLFNLKSGYVSGSGKQVTFIDNGFVLDASMKETRSCVFKCNLKKGNTYFLSFDTTNVSGTGVAFAFLPKLLQYFSLNKAFTPTEDTDELAIYINSEDVPTVLNITNIQVSFANAKKYYEPFTEQSVTIVTPNGLPGIPVTTGGNYTDANGQQWVCDEIDFYSSVLRRRMLKLVFNGSSGFTLHSINDHGIANFHCALPYKVRNVLSLCSHLTSQNALAGDVANNGYLIANATSSSTLYIRVSQDKAATVEDFNEFLADDPMSFLFVLDTPQETPLSETEIAAYRALHTNKPNATIINNSGAYMSVDYTADTKLYIDNKIKEALQ